MKIDACGATHRGGTRNHNEDNIYLDGEYRQDVRHQDQIIRSVGGDKQGRSANSVHCFAVFDGLGGGEYGELASITAARELTERLTGYAERPAPAGCAESLSGCTDGDVDNALSDNFIRSYISEIHRKIRWLTIKENLRDMGTTAAMLLITEDGRALAANLGDSRIYQFRDGWLVQMSHDHTQIQSMIDSGLIQDRRQMSRSFGHLLTQYAGIKSEDGAGGETSIAGKLTASEIEAILANEPEPEPYTDKFTAESGDIYLICSDGLTETLDDGEIAGILQQHETGGPDHMALNLIKTAIERKCRDNVSVIIARIQ